MNNFNDESVDTSKLAEDKEVSISGIHHHGRGPTGPTGPTGPAGTPGGVTSAAYVASTDEQAIPAAAAPGAQGGAVTFNYSVVNGTAITFFPPSSSIIINEPGYYNISWEVNAQGGTNAFALFFDPIGVGPAAMVPGSNYGTLTGGETYQGQVIALLPSAGVLTLNRIDTMGVVTLQNTASGAPVISASVVIEKVG